MRKLGIYIHIPYCRSKCSYCDFFSLPGPDVPDEYIRALAREIRFYAAEWGAAYTADTVYIGGGTPSLLSLQQSDYLFRALHSSFRISRKAEISLEVNPESVTYDYLKGFKALGGTRISIGVQSFQDRLLKSVRRIASRKDIIRSIESVRQAGFDNYSFDLIFGLPHQSARHFRDDLNTGLTFGPAHFSLYSLMIPENTAIAAFYAGNRQAFMPDDDAAACYEYADARLEENNIYRYEISNFAKKNYECRHNMKYWKARPYLGLGASAVSCIRSVRWKNTADIRAYTAAVHTGRPETETELIRPRDRHNEKIMLGLRTAEGIEAGCIAQPRQRAVIDEFINRGFARKTGNRIHLTVKGVLVSNRIIQELML